MNALKEFEMPFRSDNGMSVTLLSCLLAGPSNERSIASLARGQSADFWEVDQWMPDHTMQVFPG